LLGKLMKMLTATARNLSRIMYVVACVALTSMMLLTVADVVLRGFKRPIVGTFDMVGLLGAVIICFSIPHTSLSKGHVMMDFLEGKLPKALDRGLQIITRILGIGLFLIIGWQLWVLGDGFREFYEVTLTLHIPQYPVAYGMAICCFTECLVLFVEMFQPDNQEVDS
jgi:TRAP-type C4-dicarboxylate transport system permease small subunit